MSLSDEKKRKTKKIFTYYEIKNGKISRKLKKCPRCGSFMAYHRSTTERLTCGKCSYTEYNTTTREALV